MAAAAVRNFRIRQQSATQSVYSQSAGGTDQSKEESTQRSESRSGLVSFVRIRIRIRIRNSLECASPSWALLQFTNHAVYDGPKLGRTTSPGTSISPASQAFCKPPSGGLLLIYIAVPPDYPGRAHGHPIPRTAPAICGGVASCSPSNQKLVQNQKFISQVPAKSGTCVSAAFCRNLANEFLILNQFLI